MRVVIDIECNALVNPTKIWVIVCKDIDSGKYHIFRKPTEDDGERERLRDFWLSVSLCIGHNYLGYDWLVLNRLLPELEVKECIDTLIISKMVDYPRQGHSIEAYGEEFGLPKIDFSEWDRYSEAMEQYCQRDVDITERIYRKYQRYINSAERRASIRTEHEFQLVCNDLENNGFAFNTAKAQQLLDKVLSELSIIDAQILSAFPPREVLIREFTPRATKFGTINRSSVPRSLHDRISEYEVGKTYRHTKLVEFNPSSHKQIIEVLNEAKWQPVDKTKTHIETERELAIVERQPEYQLDITAEQLYTRLQELRRTGWKVNEKNLETLPDTAPEPARLLAKRILLEARRRTLVEWLSLIKTQIEIEKTSFGEIGTEINGRLTQSGKKDSAQRIESGVQTILKSQEKATEEVTLNIPTDYRTKILLEWLKSKKVDVGFVKENANSTWITVTGMDTLESCCAALATVVLDGTKSIHPKYKIIAQRIHGKFGAIGAWSHRMNHQNPNTANIPNEFDTSGKKKLYGKELRSLWIAPKGRLLVGCDAEGIQLRIFAHYIDDPAFTQALINGKKEDKSDPHSLNQSILGPVCKTRQAAKRYIYALLLGAGAGKLREILECSEQDASQAYERLLERYTGFAYLKEKVIPADAKRGWFVGLDGRAVRIPGDAVGQRKHLCMSGYLQNGEAVAMKLATLKWWPRLKEFNAKIVNFVHDEWQVEVPNDVSIAMEVAKMMANSLKEVGEDLKLKCPLAGSYWNDDLKDYTIGTKWSVTH